MFVQDVGEDKEMFVQGVHKSETMNVKTGCYEFMRLGGFSGVLRWR